ncbi:MAG TPA: MFS transporter, partial [Stellaceae bacterium]|nr:MFS transporter [Stellaceae bacterium]
MATQFVPDLERQTIRKVVWRLLPLIVIAYFVAYIDRTNVAFAALTMNKDLGLSSYAFGFGAGIFFIGYFLFEVPSNIALEKVGARLWIARIMISWGLVSGAMAFAAGPVSFTAMRFLLGAAEAGFFPGMILYFTYWFPARYRGRVVALLYMAVPISNGLGAALSGVLLGLDGALGFKGWQWLFLLEALPAIGLGFIVLWAMTDRPAVAKWLTQDQKDWLEGELQQERRALLHSGSRHKLWHSFTDGRVLLLCFLYFLTTTANYGITFFMPQILKGFGQSDLITGLLAAIPYLLGMIGLLAWGISSDRTDERRWHFISACLVGGVGLASAALFSGSYSQLAMLALATVGIYGSRPPFWPMPSRYLTGTAAAGGIALVNSVGNLGGYAGPVIVGWIKDSTNGFVAPLYFLAASAVLAAVIGVLAPGIAG